MIGGDSTSVENPNRRVKVYVLGVDGQWDDRGTGYVKCEIIPEYDSLGFRVVAENQPMKELLVTRIFEEEVFQRQGDTIVTWTNPDTKEDVALSFQEACGAQQVWELVCQVQRRSPHPHDGGDGDGDGGGGLGVGLEGALAHDVDVGLPEPNTENLEALLDVLSSVTHHTRDKVVHAVLADDFLDRLLHLLEELEGDGKGEHEHHHHARLHALFRVVRGLVTLSEPALIATLLSDRHVASTFGVLEYDPDYADLAEQRTKYRLYLARKHLFKTAVPIRCEATLRQIHLSFRLAYLRDVVMARYIDDGCFATVREMMASQAVEILGHLESDPDLLPAIFRLCRGESVEEDGVAGDKGGDKGGDERDTDEERRNGFLFLREILDMAKPLGVANQIGVYRALCAQGLLRLLEQEVDSGDGAIRTACREMLLATLKHDVSLLRGHVVKEGGGGLLGHLVAALVALPSDSPDDPARDPDADSGLKAQVGELLRGLLDLGVAEALSPEKDEFVGLVYERHMPALLRPLAMPPPTPPTDAAGRPAATAEWVRQRESWSEACGQVVEVLSLCVQQHGHRIKYFVLRHKVIDKVAALLRQRDKVLALSALRFLRQCIGADDFYGRYMAKNDLLGDVARLLELHVRRDNLVNSAVLELVEFVRQKNMRGLIRYLVSRYAGVFRHVTYVDTFRLLLIRHEENEAADMAARARGSDARAGAGGRGDGAGDDDLSDEEALAALASGGAAGVGGVRGRRIAFVEGGAEMGPRHGMVGVGGIASGLLALAEYDEGDVDDVEAGPPPPPDGGGWDGRGGGLGVEGGLRNRRTGGWVGGAGDVVGRDEAEEGDGGPPKRARRDSA